MARVNTQKTVTSKADFDKVVDSSFKFFVGPTEEEDNDTVEELFRLYEKLYYEIPLNGEENSHEALIRESSKLVDIEKDNEEIQPLLDEISQLRRQLLETQETLSETEVENERNAQL